MSGCSWLDGSPLCPDRDPLRLDSTPTGSTWYRRLGAEHLKRVGGGLETAVNNYNKFVGSFERNVLTSGRRLAEKGIEIGKREIEEVPLVEGAPRYGAEDVAALDAPDASSRNAVGSEAE